MPIQFNNVREDLFSKGIDARSAENQISEGFVRDALNVDIVQKHAKKRTGHSGYAGNMPVRVTSVEYNRDDQQICFNVDLSSGETVVDLLSVRSSPIVVYGRGSNNNGNNSFFTGSDNAYYFPEFTQKTRQLFQANTSDTIVLNNNTNGLPTVNAFVEVARTGAVGLSNELIEYDSLTIKANRDIQVAYTNAASAFQTFIYYANKAAVPGSVYIHTAAQNTNTTVVHSIAGTLHQLSTYNIVTRCYRQVGSDWVAIKPDTVTLDTITGDVQVTITNNTPEPFSNFKVILSAAPAGNIRTGSISNQTYTINIPQVTSPFMFPSVYREVSPGSLTEVYPDSVVYSESANSTTITLNNVFVANPKFIVYWEYGYVRSTQICVDFPITLVGTGTASDTLPQMTIWGLDHSEIYGPNKSKRMGWTTHLDTYRIAAESRVVAGLGGNIYTAREYTESGTKYKYGSLYPRLSNRTASSVTLAPTFWLDGEMPGRTRGYITGTATVGNTVKISSVQWSPSGTTYTLSIPGKKLLKADGNVFTTEPISDIFTVGDTLHVTQMSRSVHNGSFPILSAVDGVNEIHILVENESVLSSDWDDIDTAGRAGIFTDSIDTQQTVLFLPGDRIDSEAFVSGTEVIWNKATSGTSGTLSNVTDIIILPSGIQLTGARESAVVPMRSSVGTSSVVNMLRGDILEYSESGLPLRIINVNPRSTETITSIVGDGITATVTLWTDTLHLRPNMRILLADAGEYTGEIQIEEILTDTTFSFSSAGNTTVTNASLIGHTVELGESILWEDTTSNSISFNVTRRMIPVEAPIGTTGFNSQATYRFHFNAATLATRPFLRSTMVQDNLYLTNGEDEVMKFDGVNIYRAGLINWQPGIFVRSNRGATNIALGLKQVEFTSPNVTDRSISVATESALNTFTIGTRVRLPGSTETFTISSSKVTAETTTPPVAATYKFYVDAGPDFSKVTAGLASEVATFRYYYRLNAVDINNNVIASAVAQSQDSVIEVTANTGIEHKLVGLPELGNYNYDRIYVQAYRTKSNEAGPFYKVFQKQLTFRLGIPYVDFVDTFRDTDLTTNDLDKTVTALKGKELGTGWEAPLRSKYLTSTGGTIVQGNVRGYPTIDIQITGNSAVTDSNFVNDKIRIRRNNTDFGTVTYNNDRITYQWRSTTDNTHYKTVTGITQNVINTSIYYFDVTVPGHPVGINPGWIYLYYSQPESPDVSLTSVTAVNDTSPLVFTLNGHGLGAGTPITVSGSPRPANTQAGITYYVVSPTANTFEISTSIGGSSVLKGTGTVGTSVKYQLANRPSYYTGWWQVSQAVNSTTLRCYLNEQQPTIPAGAAFPDRCLFAESYEDVPVPIGLDYNCGQVNGNSPVVIFTAARRLAAAINTTMRAEAFGQILTSPRFSPWMIARGGSDTATAGRILIQQPQVLTATLCASWIKKTLTPANTNTYQVFMNNTQLTESTTDVSGNIITPENTRSTQVSVFPSRVLFGYPNFPEIMDSPTTQLDTESDSAVDINPADGQEITGIIPFFGEAAFGSAQQSGVVVVFKENSIYLVDINEKRKGLNAVQRIESEGIGCTVPNSIAVTKGGIMFANDSGLYALRRSMAVEFVGKYIDRLWKQVDRSDLTAMQGHHYTLGRQYKLAVPLEDGSTEVLVYDHTNEAEAGVGAWTRYDAHNAIGWCNLGQDAFFATTEGRVMRLRRAGDSSDYQDDHSAINFQLQTRPLDFGVSGSRKVLGDVTVQYRTESSGETEIGLSVDTEQEYDTTTPVVVTSPTSKDNMSDKIGQDIETVKHSMGRRKGTQFSLQIKNTKRLQGVEIAGMEFRVAAYGSGQGQKSAADTSKKNGKK